MQANVIAFPTKPKTVSTLRNRETVLEHLIPKLIGIMWETGGGEVVVHEGGRSSALPPTATPRKYLRPPSMRGDPTDPGAIQQTAPRKSLTSLADPTDPADPAFFEQFP